MLQHLLESEGFDVRSCEDGIRGLELAKRKCFEIVVTDYKMPKMTGDVVTFLLRQSCPDAFIIGVSAEFQERAFLEAGANVFVYKELLPQRLGSLIANRN